MNNIDQHPVPRILEDSARTAIVLVLIIAVCALTFLARCLPSRSNEVPKWVRNVRHWALVSLKGFVRSFPDALDGPLMGLKSFLSDLYKEGQRP